MSHFLSGKTLVLPFDFSDAAVAAVDEAIRMSDENTRICMLHVLVPMHVLAIEPGIVVDLGTDSRRIEGAVRAMREQVKVDRPIEMAARIGDPGSEIVAHAKEINADLIVMPSHGRSGIKRLLLGSVAERVVRLAECPVMVLRDANMNA